MSDTPKTISHYPRARLWLGLSVIVAVLGMVASVLWVVWRLSVVDDRVAALQRFTEDDGTVLVVDEAADWTIYIEPGDRRLSGVRFSLEAADGGKTVPLTGAINDVEYSVGESGRPVSRAVLEPGEYIVNVSPGDVTLAIGDDVGDQVQVMWLGAILIALPTVVVGGIAAGVNGLRVTRGSGPPPGRRTSDSDRGETDDHS